MLMLLALGAMSLNWMLLVAVLILGQKLLPPRASIDMALALAIVALGLVVVVAPAAAPGLTPSM
jgi:predicted metal-binding membrane protein